MIDREIDKRKVRIFEIENNWIIIAGKAAADNEYVSLELAQPEDYWFHTDGHAGSHVLLFHQDGIEARRPILEIAAGVAAYYSKARNAKKVGVTMTRAKNVGKRRGSPLGQVIVQREQTLRVVPGLPES